MEMIQSTRRYNQLNLQENSSILLRKSRSIQWKILHGIISMFGGIFLTGGSSMYFSYLIKRYSIALSLGGWFLSIGSFCLLLTDLQEYFSFRSSKDRNVETLAMNDQFEDSECLVIFPLEKRNERWKCLSSAFGSAFYLIGSILLIPFFHPYITTGNWLIIIGSILIFISSLWKIFPNGFHSKDRLGLITNIFIGLGGLFYLFGIIILMCGLNGNISASLCVMGGCSFILASLFLQYRYFITRH